MILRPVGSKFLRRFRERTPAFAVSVSGGRLEPENDATLGEVVRGKLHLDFVARQEPDPVHPHLTREVARDVVAILESDSEISGREKFLHATADLYKIL